MDRRLADTLPSTILDFRLPIPSNPIPKGLPTMPQSILAQLQTTINERKTASPETSYTAQLLHKGQDKILKKVIEEAGEVLMASKDGDAQHIVYEIADLWFHSIILLAHHNLSINDVLAELARRQGLSGLVEKASRPNE